MFEDVVDDDFLGFVGMNSGEGIHVDDGVFEADEWEPQGALQSLDSEIEREGEGEGGRGRGRERGRERSRNYM